MSKIAHDVENIDHVAGLAGAMAYRIGKQGFDVLKGLLNPCQACKSAINAGIEKFECGGSESQIEREVSECEEAVVESQPEESEYSPLVCSALKFAVSKACETGDQNTSALKKARSKLVDEVCHQAHLC